MSNDETQVIKMAPAESPKTQPNPAPDTALWTWPLVALVGILCATVVAVAWICSGAF